MKIIIEIEPKKMTKTFINDDNKIYKEVWKQEGIGSKTQGTSIVNQMENDELDEDFIELVNSIDGFDLWHSEFIEE